MTYLLGSKNEYASEVYFLYYTDQMLWFKGTWQPGHFPWTYTERSKAGWKHAIPKHIPWGELKVTGQAKKCIEAGKDSVLKDIDRSLVHRQPFVNCPGLVYQGAIPDGFGDNRSNMNVQTYSIDGATEEARFDAEEELKVVRGDQAKLQEEVERVKEDLGIARCELAAVQEGLVNDTSAQESLECPIADAEAKEEELENLRQGVAEKSQLSRAAERDGETPRKV
ncbi:hypothetical protein QBC39DRAFT_334283 [Podospora conica]|nr:hypothetical protein QBC39DRAFT_334283 [Schizothecium conicum]